MFKDKDGNESTLYEVPQNLHPPNSKQYFNLNYFAIQLNNISEDLHRHIAPTDARHRPDLRAWEDGNFDKAMEEKDRLEQNQRVRRSEVKEALKEINGSEPNMYDETSFYKPHFFDKATALDSNGKE